MFKVYSQGNGRGTTRYRHSRLFVVGFQTNLES